MVSLGMLSPGSSLDGFREVREQNILQKPKDQRVSPNC